MTTGSWSQTPTSLGYQWQRCNMNGRLCAPIPGATDTTYLVTSADTGHALIAVVQATAGVSTQSAWSVASAPAGTLASGPAASLAPTVTGALQARRQLAGATGTWSGTGPIRFTYQWYRCDASGAHCASVHGATRSTYTQVAKDVGQTIGFAVHATDLNGTTIAYAALAGPVAAPDAALVSTSQPTLSGTPTPGQTLQVTAGSWSRPPAALAYQWQRCNANGRVCTPIDGATGTSYTVTAADAGHELVAVVTATAGKAAQATFSTALSVH